MEEYHAGLSVSNEAMPYYLIHVGPHKTGTTYLQLRFDAARDRLRRNGVAYPAEWSSAVGEPSHRKLVVGLREARVGELRSQFEAIERDAPDFVLISAEGINHLDRLALELLKTLLGGHPVTIIFYCRRWSELLPSLWQEEVKHGYDKTFPEFFASNLADPFDSEIMNFARRLEIYSAVFGRENIRLVSYSNLSDFNIDLAEHFFDTFLTQHRSLIDGLPDLPVARPNRSLAPLEVEVIRALHSYNIANGIPPPDSTLRNWYMAQAQRFDLADLSRTIQASAATLTYSDASPGAQRLQEELATAYMDLVVQPAQSGYLFKPRRADIRYFHQRYFTNRMARQALEGLYTTFRVESQPGSQHPGGPGP